MILSNNSKNIEFEAKIKNNEKNHKLQIQFNLKENIIETLADDLYKPIKWYHNPEYKLFEESVIKDVMFGPLNFGYTEDAAREQSIKALKMVGIDESLYEKSPLELSGGQKRRVAIAGVLSSDPDIIVLDEPTSGLDPKGTKDIMSIFKELNEKYNKTIILICHDMNVVYEYAHNVVAMKDGMVAYCGSTVDLFSNEQLLNHLSLAAPRVVSFANELNKKGFSTDPKLIKNMDDLVDSIVKEMKLWEILL